MSSGTTGTTSSCSYGRTSRNQPTAPATDSRAPRQLTDVLVTRPANSSAAPSAKMNGHAVGAGTSISRGARGLSLNCSIADGFAIYTSASKNVNYGENHDPYCIDEVPVHREHFDATRLLHSHTATKSEHRNGREHDETCGDVKRVQADERVICRSKQVGRDGQAVFVDETVPFLGRAVKE